ncbi:RecA-like DNA recombinase [Gordonia phage Wojtek]|uniref:RecA-like DNA recombinase n=1 Tax=Gordonia phage Wojtek TaxID=2910758 RepID=A0AA49BMV9_9CAUD|nr:RecA-like DNA recombinase [Gordonia phage Wojtek]
MSSLPADIVDLQEFDDSINLGIYGPSGVGKTVLAGSDDKVLFLAVEKGTVSAKRQGSKAKVWPIKQWNDLEKAYKWLEANPDVFQWVVLDSVTEMQQMAIREILAKAHAENGSRDLDIPAIQDHQKWQNIYKRFINYFVELPIDTVFLFLVRTAVDEDKNEFLTPDIQGKNYQLSQYTCGQMSAYGYMSNRKVAMKNEKGEILVDTGGKRVPQIIRRITWMDTGTIRGKDRYNVLEPYTEDLTLRDIRMLIEGEVTREDLGQFIRPKVVGTKEELLAQKKAEKAKANSKPNRRKAEQEAKAEEVETEAEADDDAAEPDDDAAEVETAKADEATHKDEKTDESKDTESDDELDFDLDGDFDFDE